MSQAQLLWLLGVSAVILAGRFAFLQSRVVYLTRMRKRWMATVTKSDDAKHLDHEDIPRLQRALREARVGVEDVTWPYTEQAGYGFVAHREVSLINNLCLPSMEVAPLANAKFGEAIGAYRMRRNDTLNPIHWAAALWTLPTTIAASLGADKNATPVRIGQVVYQLLVVIGLVLKVYLQWASLGH